MADDKIIEFIRPVAVKITAGNYIWANPGVFVAVTEKAWRGQMYYEFTLSGERCQLNPEFRLSINGDPLWRELSPLEILGRTLDRE